MPLECGERLAGRRVPQPYRPVVTRGGKGLAVRTESHCGHPVLVPIECGAGAAGRHIPQPHFFVVARGGEGLAVGAESHGLHHVHMFQDTYSIAKAFVVPPSEIPL